MDLNKKLKVDATVRFLDEPASESCMSGPWKRVVVEHTATYKDNFFPLTSPLAFQLQGGKIALGSTGRCDAYLFLSGWSNKSSIRGSYDEVGMASRRKLGHFTLQRIP